MCTQLHTKDVSRGATSHLSIPWLTSGRQNPSPKSLRVGCCCKQRLVLQVSPYRAWTQAAIDILHIVHARNNHTPCPGFLLQRSTLYLTDRDGGKVLTKAAKGNSYPFTPLEVRRQQFIYLALSTEGASPPRRPEISTPGS